MVRFACLGGLLVGLEDLEKQKAARNAGLVTNADGKGEVDEVVVVRRRTRGKVEEEAVITLAEVMEAYPLPINDRFANEGEQRSDWESDFVHSTSGTTSTGEFILPAAKCST